MKEHPSRNSIRRDITRLLRNNGTRSFRVKEMAKQLGYRDNETYRLFCDVLNEMADQRLIGKAKGGQFTWRPQQTRVEGVLHVNPQGFGFVDVEGMEEDLYVRGTNMRNALDGDLVRVGLSASDRRDDSRREAEVLEVVERRRQQVVGTFKRHKYFAYVVTDDKRMLHDVYIDAESFNGAQEGDKVVASIDAFEDWKALPEGRVLEIIGAGDDPAARVLALAMSYDVRAGFPPEAIQEADAILLEIPVDALEGRLDLRAERIFTIDPVDAKDFDDAIHVTVLPGGNYEVGVHIADVSHYVAVGSAIDREAYLRGTSVYLVDRTIPMLPERLSNGVCSLRPHEDKLTYSCIMEVTPRGKVVSWRIAPSVIHSQARLTYEEAQAMLDGGDGPMAEDVRRAGKLSATLTNRRMREGAVDFDLPEVRVVLDEAGKAIGIHRKERTASNRLIEEFMLLANRCVAEEIGKRKPVMPFVYRIHDRPDEEKIRMLSEYVRAFGYHLEIGKLGVESKQLNALLERVRGAAEARVIEEAALRAMAKARYSINNVGHYGLAFPFYTHFTSPIRRYPDLMVHRLLRRYLAGGSRVEPEPLEQQCEYASGRERAAADAERESVKLKQVEYIREHLGETFRGVVSGVTKFGVFVELSDLLVQGMVHVRDMDDDYYEYDERSYRLVGRHTHKSYRLGDTVQVVVAGASIETREVDLLFTD